jgi:hypothetical protein
MNGFLAAARLHPGSRPFDSGFISLSISVLILTLNDKINLPSCLEFVAWSDDHGYAQWVIWRNS